MSSRAGHSAYGRVAREDAAHIQNVCGRHDGVGWVSDFLLGLLEQGRNSARDADVGIFENSICARFGRRWLHCVLHDAANGVCVFWKIPWPSGGARESAGDDDAAVDPSSLRNFDWVCRNAMLAVDPVIFKREATSISSRHLLGIGVGIDSGGRVWRSLGLACLWES